MLLFKGNFKLKRKPKVLTKQINTHRNHYYYIKKKKNKKFTNISFKNIIEIIEQHVFIKFLRSNTTLC